MTLLTQIVLLFLSTAIIVIAFVWAIYATIIYMPPPKSTGAA